MKDGMGVILYVRRERGRKERRGREVVRKPRGNRQCDMVGSVSFLSDVVGERCWLASHAVVLMGTVQNHEQDAMNRASVFTIFKS